MTIDVLQGLAAAGDLSTICLFFILWRFDRRLVIIEERTKGIS